MRCGSLQLRGVKASEGSIGVAFFDLAKCRDCGWQGMPLEFDDEASWRAFVQAKRDEGEVAQPVAACRQCGARDLRFEGEAAFCPHCLWRGAPIEFKDERTWLQFAESRKNWKGRGGEAG
jgi:ribosomal protein L40E